MARAPGVRWTREHFLIALNLYCKLPFGKLHKGNPIIVEVAQKMGRTPSSLAMKLCNFASLDPVQQARGIRGLQGATSEDRAMWNEFHKNMTGLAPESEQMLHDLFAMFSALFGWWNEQLTSDRAFVTALKHIVKANVLAMHAILDGRTRSSSKVNRQNISTRRTPAPSNRRRS